MEAVQEDLYGGGSQLQVFFHLKQDLRYLLDRTPSHLCVRPTTRLIPNSINAALNEIRRTHQSRYDYFTSENYPILRHLNLSIFEHPRGEPLNPPSLTTLSLTRLTGITSAYPNTHLHQSNPNSLNAICSNDITIALSSIPEERILAS